MQPDTLEDPLISPTLASALQRFRRFLEGGRLRSRRGVERSDRGCLTAQISAVDPLREEVNRVLDRLVATAHPQPAVQDDLEADLNSLAQAAMEARQKLSGRPE